MPSRTLTILLAASLVAGVLSCKSESNSPDSTPVLSGPPRTTFPMPPLNSANAAGMGWVTGEDNSGHIKMSDYTGRVLVLDFYATWCVPCRESIPHLIQLQQRYASQGLEVVGLNVGGPDDRVKVPDFKRELEVNYPLGFPDKALTDLLLSDNDAIPQSFVFNREGLLVKRFIGYSESTGREIEEAILKALD